MLKDDSIFIGVSRHADDSLGEPQYLALNYANRHGLITGATGTGKTVSLQVLAEGFSRAGVPVFAADIKGDLSGIAAASLGQPFLAKRAAEIGFTDKYTPDICPAVFYDLFGERGSPVRTTISDMGPLLLSRLLDLNPTQEGVLNIAFRIADEEHLLLLDLKDLQALLADMAARAGEVSGRYGNVTRASVGAIQRQLLVLQEQGGDRFFGEPSLEIADLMRAAVNGRGVVSLLAADRLMQAPRLYATFLLWLLSELFEQLPEVGDPAKPRLVFFFDEAHLLFADAPRALVEKVEQVVKLIRSKGVGVYLVTQNPVDIPESVLAQLGNRVQHALRAYTPREQKAVRSAAETFRPNPELVVAEAISKLAVGEALVSTLEAGGVPSMVQRTLVRPPSARVGPITDAERVALVGSSPVAGKYDRRVDRESAYEILAGRTNRAAQAPQPQEQPDPRSVSAPQAREPAAPPPAARPGDGGSGWPDMGGILNDVLGGGGSGRRAGRQTVVEAAVKSVVRSAGSSLGRALVRGVLGSLRR